MTRRHTLQTLTFFILVYALAPWACKLVVEYFEEDTLQLSNAPIVEAKSLPAERQRLDQNMINEADDID